jgi:hypothetical protein
MPLYSKWCKVHRSENKRKRLWKFIEKANGRDAVKTQLYATVRSHYDSVDRIADDVEKLGFKIAAEILRERLPRTKKARSGDLGEILACELVEEEMHFTVPVRRLRYKDGREMALRGDDFIGVRWDEDKGLLQLLKGESKSRITLAETTITKARASLNRDNGRCTPSSLLFVADRLLDDDDDDKVALGQALREEVGTKSLPATRIDHVLFTMSGNVPPEALEDDLKAASSGRNHTVINIRIEDHQQFIAETYEGAEKVGND